MRAPSALVRLSMLLVLAGCVGPGSEPHVVPDDPVAAGTSPLPASPPVLGGGTTTVPVPRGPFERVVVSRKWPLALANPQRDTIAWPIWGGAFTLADASGASLAGPLSVSASMIGGSEPGARGLLVAAEGPISERAGAAILWDDSGWVLREVRGPRTVAEVPLPADETGEFVIEIEPSTVRVVGTLGEAELALSTPLAVGDAAVGLYAWLDPATSLSMSELSLTSPLPLHPELGAPLRTLAEGRGVDLGAATDVWPPVHDLGFESLLGEQFGRAAPTEFYWATTRGEDADWFLVPADLMVNYATLHEQEVTGMFLVWDFELPTWLTDLASSQDPQTLQAVLDDHITTLVSRYRGRVDAWVVVNEAVWGPHDWWGWRARYASTLWFENLGPNYIERAFTTARAADPDAVLVYNETGAEELNEKSDFVYDMLADFVARGVPVDAVGLQFHVRADRPPDRTRVQANLERFGQLGLDVYLTEIDVSLEGVPGTEDERLALQALVYEQIVDACLAVQACKSMTVFGISDRHAWDELGDASPLLFDESYGAKPAYFAVQSALTK